MNAGPRVRHAAAALWLSCSAVVVYAAEPIGLHVDLRSIPHRIVHATLRLPVKPGPLTLRYPQWLPGDHGPTGPIGDIAGLFVHAGDRDLGWSRVPEDIYSFRIDVPEGISELTIDVDHLMPPGPDGVPEGASASAKLAILNWSHVLLAPAGVRADAIDVRASVDLPAGWSFGTALPIAASKGAAVVFEPVTAEMLVDSPLLAGEYFRRIVLDDRPDGRVLLEIAADAPADLAVPPGLEQAFKNLVKESDALFRSRHFRDYHFLVALSEQVSQFALEHHASSDNRLRERSFVDDDAKRLMADTLAHEYAHSWNGKFRRPGGLRPADFAKPIDSSLLWVYEGLTQYLGWMLAARSGQTSLEESLDTLAVAAAEMDTHRGRAWRTLEDTGTSAQVLYMTPPAWTAWRRGTDFYDEGLLVWLDVDVTIRRFSKGTKSLDDFCRAFLGGGTGRIEVRTYEFEDVVAALRSVVPYDWAGFLNERVRGRAAHPPLEGIKNGGYKLEFDAEPSPLLQAAEALDETIDERYSIGLLLGDEGGVVDVVPGTKLWDAGIAPGMKVVAVNDRRFSADILRDAIRAGAAGTAPLRLLVENADYFRTVAIEIAGGLKYPRLVRGPGDDLLGSILAPKAGKPYNNEGNTRKR